MSLHRSGPPQSSRVVSVRLDVSLADRLDDLSARTGRKRSFYVKEALNRLLPYLEEKYWADSVRDRQLDEGQEFERLIRSLHRDDSPPPDAE